MSNVGQRRVTPRPLRTAAVLLAAGQSTRLGESKQLLRDDHGVPMVRRMARVLLDGGCDLVVVVTGADADAVARAARGSNGEHDAQVILVHNAQFADGMGTSIACGAQQAISLGADAVLVATCDMPAVDAAHIDALLRESGGSRRVASSYATEDGSVELILGVPAVFPRPDLARLVALSGDQGARSLIRLNDTLSVFIRYGNLDLDTPADVDRWRSNVGGQ